MIKLICLLVLPLFLFAHKINLFLDYENGNLFISSYFANAKGCANCAFEIKDKENNLILQDKLDANGEFNYKTHLQELSVFVDAGAGHIVRKTMQEVSTTQEQKKDANSDEYNKLLEENQALKNHIKVLQEQLNYFELFKVIFGLIIIGLIFLFLKRVKR